MKHKRDLTGTTGTVVMDGVSAAFCGMLEHGVAVAGVPADTELSVSVVGSIQSVFTGKHGHRVPRRNVEHPACTDDLPILPIRHHNWYSAIGNEVRRSQHRSSSAALADNEAKGYSEKRLIGFAPRSFLW